MKVRKVNASVLFRIFVEMSFTAQPKHRSDMSINRSLLEKGLSFCIFHKKAVSLQANRWCHPAEE